MTNKRNETEIHILPQKSEFFFNKLKICVEDFLMFYSSTNSASFKFLNAGEL